MAKSTMRKSVKATDKQATQTGEGDQSAFEQTPSRLNATSLASLQRLAEELGRMVARSLNRRAYSLPQLMIGALVMALMLLLVLWLLGWHDPTLGHSWIDHVNDGDPAARR